MEPKAEDIQSIIADVACGLYAFCTERSNGSNEVFRNYSKLTHVLPNKNLKIHVILRS